VVDPVDRRRRVRGNCLELALIRTGRGKENTSSLSDSLDSTVITTAAGCFYLFVVKRRPPSGCRETTCLSINGGPVVAGVTLRPRWFSV
jgi:hypothetical protein